VQWSSEAENHYFGGKEEWSQDDNVNGKTFFSRFTQKLNKGFLPKDLDFYSHHRELTFLSQDTAL
jgi:hypothetical protein